MLVRGASQARRATASNGFLSPCLSYYYIYYWQELLLYTELSNSVGFGLFGWHSGGIASVFITDKSVALWSYAFMVRCVFDTKVGHFEQLKTVLNYDVKRGLNRFPLPSFRTHSFYVLL